VSKQVLLLSYSFPPQALAEAFLSAKTMGNIPNTQVDVICGESVSFGISSDPSLDDYVKSRFRNVEKVKQSSLFRILPKKRIPAKLMPLLGQYPDSFVFTNGAVLKRAKKLDLSKYDALVTWSQYHSIHLVGLEIKKLFPKLRWIAHLSDPWIDNSYVHYNSLARHINSQMEKAVMNNADKIVLTSKLSQELIMQKYPEEIKKKSIVIPHPYDPALYVGLPHTRREAKKIFRYLGTFYGERSPEPLFKGLARLLTKKPELLGNVVFELVGEIEKHYFNSEAYRFLPNGLIRVRPSVSYTDSLKLMCEADALLVVDAPADKPSVFLPSKLVDYFGAGKLLVGITPPGTSMTLIEKAGGFTADPRDIDKIAMVLEKAIDAILSGKKCDYSVLRNQFKAEVVGKQMYELLP
jgi:glycosyltransferase involved in cell wall biosynthesis